MFTKLDRLKIENAYLQRELRLSQEINHNYGLLHETMREHIRLLYPDAQLHEENANAKILQFQRGLGNE